MARVEGGHPRAILRECQCDFEGGVTRGLYAADWCEADERNSIVLRQLAEAGMELAGLEPATSWVRYRRNDRRSDRWGLLKPFSSR
jgi:hypothetical protein